MANFKQHISFGAFTGFWLATFTYLLDWVTHVYFVFLIFFTTIIGSFLPDMDSNTGLPSRIIFGLYSYFSAALTIFYLSEVGASIYLKIFLPAASFVFVQVYLEKIFQKFTSHRGIFHSVPAFLIIFFLVIVVADTTRLKTLEKFVLALSLSTGYFCHLLLDEVYAVNFLMSPSRSRKKIKLKDFSFKKYLKKHFGVKKSFGTALDFGFNQRERYPGVIAWTILVILIYLSWSTLVKIYKVI